METQAMETQAIAEIGGAPYVSLATFRKTGEAVRTPVWVAPDGGRFYVFSAADAGKVKRLKNSSRAELAVCDVRGRVSGAWQGARAVLVTDAAEINQALHALRRKYGWQMWLADAGARLTGRFDRRAYIRVELTGE
jgi:PPOX class probable F420-dependent enzyme